MATRSALSCREVWMKSMIASLLSLSTVIVGACLLIPSLRAAYLFKELKTLELGYSTFDDAQRLATRIHAKSDLFGACNKSECTWRATIDNSRIPGWWRGTGESFAVTFSVKNSLVVYKSTIYSIGLDGDFHPSTVTLEEQEHWSRRNAIEPIEIGWGSTDLYPYYQFGVRMTPKASTQDRRRYTSFNFNCLWKYKGCNDARDLLPAAKPLAR